MFILLWQAIKIISYNAAFMYFYVYRLAIKFKKHENIMHRCYTYGIQEKTSCHGVIYQTSRSALLCCYSFYHSHPCHFTAASITRHGYTYKRNYDPPD